MARTFGREQRTCGDIHHKQSGMTIGARRLEQLLIRYEIGTESTYGDEDHEVVDVVLNESAA